MLPLINPATNTLSFGLVPALRLVGEDFATAEIRLFRGHHIGPHRGFGARHIWAEHRRELEKSGLFDESEVAEFVGKIVKDGTHLYFEGASWKTTRLLAVRGAKGQAVLEYRQQRDGAVWSIVTAFAGKKTHGTLVGTVR